MVQVGETVASTNRFSFSDCQKEAASSDLFFRRFVTFQSPNSTKFKMETKDLLVPEERIKMCRELRSRQVENYKKFMALQEQQQPQPQRLLPRKPNKKGTTVHFHSSYILQSAIEEVDGKQGKWK